MPYQHFLSDKGASACPADRSTEALIHYPCTKLPFHYHNPPQPLPDNHTGWPGFSMKYNEYPNLPASSLPYAFDDVPLYDKNSDFSLTEEAPQVIEETVPDTFEGYDEQEESEIIYEERQNQNSIDNEAEYDDYDVSESDYNYNDDDIEVEIPVYLSNTKHDVKVEIQLRTIAMDFWASLEHELRYKTSSKVPESVRRELFRVAETIAMTDREMEEIANELQMLD